MRGMLEGASITGARWRLEVRLGSPGMTGFFCISTPAAISAEYSVLVPSTAPSASSSARCSRLLRPTATAGPSSLICTRQIWPGSCLSAEFRQRWPGLGPRKSEPDPGRACVTACPRQCVASWFRQHCTILAIVCAQVLCLELRVSCCTVPFASGPSYIALLLAARPPNKQRHPERRAAPRPPCQRCLALAARLGRVVPANTSETRFAVNRRLHCKPQLAVFAHR